MSTIINKVKIIIIYEKKNTYAIKVYVWCNLGSSYIINLLYIT